LLPGEDDQLQCAMRQLISENKIVRAVVEKVDNANDYVEKVTEGPCVVVATTTTEQNHWNDEFVNRCSWLRSNDSYEQTQLVLGAQAANASSPWNRDQTGIQKQLKVWQEYHRSLRPRNVVIPFAGQITPTSLHVSVRRLFPLVLLYTSVSALLHQRSRQEIENESGSWLQATIEDYEIAHRLLQANAPRVLDPVSKPAKTAYAKLRSKNKFSLPFSTHDAQMELGEPASTVRRWMHELVAADWLVREDKYGKQNSYSLGTPIDRTQDLGLVLPSAVSLNSDACLGE
ncbi:MAG: hypothetical protein ACRD3W_04425, partial [Terriglobales bacterium]